MNNQHKSGERCFTNNVRIISVSMNQARQVLLHLSFFDYARHEWIEGVATMQYELFYQLLVDLDPYDGVDYGKALMPFRCIGKEPAIVDFPAETGSELRLNMLLFGLEAVPRESVDLELWTKEEGSSVERVPAHAVSLWNILLGPNVPCYHIFDYVNTGRATEHPPLPYSLQRDKNLTRRFSALTDLSLRLGFALALELKGWNDQQSADYCGLDEFSATKLIQELFGRYEPAMS